MSNDTVPVPQFADQDWYTKAVDYWSSVDPTVNGMLGGFESVCPVETAASLDLIHEFVDGIRGARNVVKKEPRIEKGYACDCGAGIGRVTKEFLLRVPFAKVDLVAKNEYLKEEIQSGKVGEVYCKGLQEFTPDAGKYDLIWCQWVLGHLTDGMNTANSCKSAIV
jgi:protein N-terminal methyltransferase